MDDEKRMIRDYEVETAIHIGGKEIIFAENLASTEPYMVCNCQWDNPLGIMIYDKAVGSTDYLEAMDEFVNRVSAEVQHIRDQRAERGVTGEPLLSAADCTPGSNATHYEGQLVIIRPEQMNASARSADQQLLLATGGNGCNPEARGQAVFCKDLFSGKTERWERNDIAGIIQPERIPEWAQERLSEMGIAPDISQHPKVYMASAEEARQRDELPVYRESNRLSAACAKDIEKAVQAHHSGEYHYNLAAALKDVTAKYGMERVQVVLANTVQVKDYDGRFSPANKEWAQSIPIPQQPREQRTGYVCETHPAILDGFINRVRKEQQEAEKKPSVTTHLKKQELHSPKKTKHDTAREEGR